MCMQDLAVNTAKEVADCNGQRSKKYNRIWVTYVMELERKLPNKLREFPSLKSLDDTSTATLKILADCTTLLKLWFFKPRGSGRYTNRNIALLILLYKHCVFTHANYKYESHDDEEELLPRYALRLYKKMVKYITELNSSSSSSLESVVQLAKEKWNITSDLEAEIESNLVFPKGYLTTA